MYIIIRAQYDSANECMWQGSILYEHATYRKFFSYHVFKQPRF